jgi:O-antigen/teichoic acid export membrane protein
MSPRRAPERWLKDSVRLLVATLASLRTSARVPAFRNRALAVLGGQLLSLVILIAGTRLITELVDGNTFGEARLAIGVAGLVGAIIVQPFSQFAMRGYHDAAAAGSVREFEGFARRSNAVAAASSALLAVALWVLYGAWRLDVDWFLAVATGVFVLGEARWSLERSLLVTRDRQAAASAAEVAMNLLLVSAAVGGILLIGKHAGALVGAQAVILVATGAWLGRMPRGAVKSVSVQVPAAGFNGSTWRADAVGFVTPLTVVSLARWFVNVGDRYLLDHVHGPRSVGHYAAVYGLCSAPLMACSGMVARLLYGTWFERGAQGRRDDDLFSGMLAVSVAIAGIALGATWAFGDIVTSVALAAEYRTDANDLMMWIVAGYGLLVVAAPFEMRAYARRATWVLGIGWGAAALVNVILNLAWIPVWGPVGAARATLASFAAYLIVLWWGTDLRSKALAVSTRQA